MDIIDMTVHQTYLYLTVLHARDRHMERYLKLKEMTISLINPEQSMGKYEIN